MPKTSTKYIFVVGGVLSGLGKGIAVSSIGLLLKGRGYRVSAMKIDPYLNVDAGTMNPTEHGEVFVTSDGLETDQDIGNYERFLDRDLTRHSYMTTGQVYLSVIERERALQYKGKCVEAVPHVPEEVIRRITTAARVNRAEIQLVEIGGTVGEYQNMIYLEAARMMHLRHPGQVQFILLSYLPIPGQLGEMKTKPTQYAVRTLNAAGIQPDFILGRGALPLDHPRKEKLSINCNMRPTDIISAPDVKNIYTIPINYERERLAEKILEKFHLPLRQRDLKTWRAMVRRSAGRKGTLTIGIVGKYFASGTFTLADSYISVIEAIKHAAWSRNYAVKIDWLEAERYERQPSALRELEQYDGVVVPGGFGSRGVEGKIAVIQYLRTHRIPFFGLCYGMQLAAVEFARHVLRLREAHTTEVRPKTKTAVIDLLPEQEHLLREHHLGGSMRLGNYPCRITAGTKTAQAYKQRTIQERHRHRYEFQNAFRTTFEEHGFLVAGVEPTRNLVEILELRDHPWFVGTQFHPELLSRPLRPHPLFVGFITSAAKQQRRTAVVRRHRK
ncbi:MAG: CTP synthase [Candidatus Kerfeldbacteria bacterium]|nr:CTP synthase [Candidatus Kerfeldbacteria bacterium]